METQILRCEICGGELKYAADGKSAQCLNCGNEFWFKEEKSGAVALALNRAAEKRRRNDFDSAIDEYRLVIHENPQDAEAHWGLAISTYGIEYVEDYRTGKLVPTCRRAVPRESILDNADFKAALEYAAPEQRAKYEEQAKEIDRLQKEIIKKIDEEEDYDVFISFKSTDDDRPTADRYIARRIYDELEKRGIKTFYSEETLKTRAFEDYEPIIFKALFSCKFFILVATDARYINSSWVKNEWSRFRDRVMEENLTGNCCAVFKNVRAGDLPAFIRKQGVDLAKYPAGGYEIELADNISVKLGKTKRQSEADEIRKQIEEQRRAFEESQKALEEKLAAAATAEKSEKTGASATVRSLLMRAGQEREDGNFDKAREYYGKVLDADPVNSDGWFGLFLCETKAKTQDKLGWKSDCAEGDFQEVIAQDDRLRSAFDGRNFRNAEKYADEKRRKEIKSYCEAQTQLYSASRRAALDRYVSFGYDKLQSGQFAQAKELFKLALGKENALPLAWMGKALACAGAADLDGMALGGNIESEQDFHAVMEHLAAAESALTSVDYDNALGSAPQELRAQWAQKREELLAACASAKQNALAQLKALAQKYLAAENFSAKRVAQAYLQYVPDDVEAQWLALFAEYSVHSDADLGEMSMGRLTMARDLQNSRIPALSASGEALALFNKRKEAIDAGAYAYAKDGLKNKNFAAVKAVCSAYEKVSSAYTVRILWLGAFAYAQETDFNALLAGVTPTTYIAKIALPLRHLRPSKRRGSGKLRRQNGADKRQS